MKSIQMKNYGKRVISTTEEGKTTTYDSSSLAKVRVGYSVIQYLQNPERKDKYGRTWEYIQ